MNLSDSPQTPLELLKMLFPEAEPQVVGRAISPRAAGQRRLLAIPHLGDIRILLPDTARAASRAFRGARHPVGLRGHAVTALGTVALRSGAGHLLASHVGVSTRGSIEQKLSEHFGREVNVAIFLGPERANRKPVLQVFAEDGELLAIAKVGVNPLTDALAKREAEVLQRLAGGQSIEAGVGPGAQSIMTPKLLAHFAWGDHQVVVQSVLPIPPKPSPPTDSARHGAMREIAALAGTSRVTLADSSYLADLRRRAEALPDAHLAAAIAQALDDLETVSPVLEFGSWHGDFSPWNIASFRDRVLVWDWERCAEDVPVGFDELHHAFLPLLKDQDIAEQEVGLRLSRMAAGALAPVGVTSEHARVVVILYLIELGTRFAGDRQDRTTSRGGAAARWLLPILQQTRELI